MNLIVLIFGLVSVRLSVAQFFDEPKCEIKKNCNLPHCNCDTTEAPVNFLKYYRRDQIPQLVILTIEDDNLDIKSYQVYKKLLESTTVRATFFVSDSKNETSYCLVRNLYENFNEIAISTVNYTCPRQQCTADRHFQPWNYELWIEQILNMRERVHRYAGISKTEILGFRAPLLEPASDMHYRIIYGNKFLYDSSIVINNDTGFVWPFTLDYPIESPLNNNGPIGTYPGLWVIPVPIYVNDEDDKLACVKLSEGQCKIDKTVNGVAKFFRRHFLRAYYNNRAPVVINIEASWLKEYLIIEETDLMPNIGFANPDKRKVNYFKKEYRNLDGLIKFIQHTQEANKDVYFVTAQQAIEYMKELPRLERELVDLKQFVEELIPSSNQTQNLDAKCDYLKQETMDFDTKESLHLDDDYGNTKKENTEKKMNDTVLAGLQSEVLFINYEIFYFIVGSSLAIIFIVLYDRIH